MTTSAITIRTYKIDQQTGEQYDVSETRTLSPTRLPYYGLSKWPPCACPQHESQYRQAV